MDPAMGTLGTAAWARYLVDFGLQHEIDAREKPAAWTTGYLGIHSTDPGTKPVLDYRTEVFQLDELLLRKVLQLSSGAALADNERAAKYRLNYPSAPANQPPRVTQCDTLAGDTYWHGALIGRRAHDWVALLTNGKGVYCTTQQEDNAVYEALRRGASAAWSTPAALPSCALDQISIAPTLARPQTFRFILPQAAFRSLAKISIEPAYPLCATSLIVGINGRRGLLRDWHSCQPSNQCDGS
jgi:hypothetical protein